MGRLRQFDESEVLQKAMLSFWKHGYEKTTVRTLETDMGINQFSIYATFKNKQELYKRVLANYQHQLDKDFLGALQTDNCNIKEVKDFLLRFSLSIAQGKVPNSCLMVNSVRELHQFDPKIKKIITGFFEAMKSHFVRAIKNSKQLGLLQDHLEEDQTAEYLVGIAQSMSTYSKIKTTKQIKQYIDFALGVISR